MRSSCLGLLLLFGCAPEVLPLHAPGDLGPFGVEVSDRAFRVRGDERVEALVLTPTTAEGAAEAAPVALVIQGGAVPVERYRWMGERLASRGLVAVMPRHALDLAIFESANGLDALEAVHRANEDEGDPLFGRVSSTPGIALGHSLGGVLAISHWLRAPDRLRHLAVFASEPNPGDAFARDDVEGARVLSIGGTADARISPAEILASFAAYEPGGTLAGAPVSFTEVEGMSHYQLTDDATEEERATDGDPSLPLDDARDAAFFLVDALADQLVTGAGADILDDPASWPDALRPSEAP